MYCSPWVKERHLNYQWLKFIKTSSFLVHAHMCMCACIYSHIDVSSKIIQITEKRVKYLLLLLKLLQWENRILKSVSEKKDRLHTMYQT